MNGDNAVIFKGRKDGLIVLLNESISFDDLKHNLNKKILEAGDFLGNAKASITFKGRELTEEEEMQLLTIITDGTNLNISYVCHGDEERRRRIAKQIFYNDKDSEMSKVYKGAVRSGRRLEFEGTVIIIGDVNPGGEVIAEGSIVVLGSLKGLAHAGAGGRNDVFIAALNMNPMQLRISSLFLEYKNYKLDPYELHPEYAFVKEGGIYIERLM